jgi:hypothetical protein
MTKDDADDVTRFLARQLAAHAIGLKCNPIRSKPPRRIQNTSLQRVPRQRRVSMLSSCLSTASFFADLHHGGFCLGGRVRILALRQGQLDAAWIPHAQPELPPRSGAAVRWNRLKIAANVVGVICSPEPRQLLVRLSQRKQRQRVLMGRSRYQQRSACDLVQLRAFLHHLLHALFWMIRHRGSYPPFRKHFLVCLVQSCD